MVIKDSLKAVIEKYRITQEMNYYSKNIKIKKYEINKITVAVSIQRKISFYILREILPL